ncbi:MAG: hypothetical protein Q4E76_06390 [Tissierellia bacterium]|nr:hypothetical protein [Tissierellia bacterium]
MKGNRSMVVAILMAIVLLSLGVACSAQDQGGGPTVRHFLDSYIAQWGYGDDDWLYLEQLIQGKEPQGNKPHYTCIPGTMTDEGYERLLQKGHFPLLELRDREAAVPRLVSIDGAGSKWDALLNVAGEEVEVHFQLREEGGSWKIQRVSGLENLVAE